MKESILQNKKELLAEKRDSLEKFIQEQMVGPGGCKYRFGLNEFSEKEEVVNTTPGSIYSTAILFPKKSDAKETESNNDGKNDNHKTNDTYDTYDEGDDDSTIDKEASGDDTDDDDDYSLERRFPNAIAISCALEESTDIAQEVKIKISGRYYRKITGEDRSKVYIHITETDEDFLKIVFETNRNLSKYFFIENKKLFISFNLDSTKEIRDELKDVKLSCAKVQETEVAKFTKIENIPEKYRDLESYRERLFRELRKSDNIYNQEEIVRVIDKIGSYEKVLFYLEDLIQLYEVRSYGFWKSETFEKYIDITDISFSLDKRSYRPEQYPKLKDIVSFQVDDQKHASLSVYLQLISSHKEVDDNNKYLKVLLRNSSSDFIESEKNRFTIVNEALNKLCFFGVKIEIESEKLCPYRSGRGFNDTNKEEDRLNFLYRSVQDYGVGHLCSVDWDKGEKPKRVWSEFLPTHEIPDVEFVPRDKYGEYEEYKNKDGDIEILPKPLLDSNNNCLNFHWLSTFSQAKNSEIEVALKEFVKSYEKWIKRLPEQDDNYSNYEAFAKYTKSECERDRERMNKNIKLILGDDENMHCFRLMNSAMLMQLYHNKDNYSDISDEKMKPSYYVNKGLSFNWRPFQLAFILLNLDGIIQRSDDPTWKARNEWVDLVWFPTGGGKTEAYLGIIALTIIQRRRKHEEIGGGVTTIMRYTLRLLATQQFQRALKLILALDQIRQWGMNDENSNYYIGKERVSIGLYIGGSSLPNKINELEEEAKKWLNGNQSKIPLDKNECPWCGKELIWGDETGEGDHFYCTNSKCSFHEFLPVQLCDELIYQFPPTLLFGTVDKFAQLARKVALGNTKDDLKKDSRRLFGVGHEINYLSPDLIIQDELHLLLGPLGSAVSLFEAAIDQLCSRKAGNDENSRTIRPKIISSTATTRNTDLQIRALYDRNVNIFPKSGVDFDDSFFAFYKRKEVNGKKEWVSKRKYLGVMPTGRTQMLTQIKLASILFVHRAIFEQDYWEKGNNDDVYSFVADHYFSVISYFNSLKEVGKTDAQFNNEFPKYIKRLYRRVLGGGGLLESFYANNELLKKEELTGRLQGSEIVETLQNVQKEFNVKTRISHIDNEKEVKYGTLPPDFILATNMISVGIDVSRFNTMIINSMPRNIAEYIQASSRVARSQKGLVITSHNPFRARDVSHFEKFIEFHRKLYFYVEPISITPFSIKSIDKYLPLYLATIIRHTFKGLQNVGDAKNITNEDIFDLSEIEDKLMEYFDKRYKNTNELSDELQKELFREPMRDYVSKFIKDALKQWKTLAESVGKENFGYQKSRYYPNCLYTETEDYDDKKSESMWVVPNSLRIVEQEAVLQIRNFY